MKTLQVTLKKIGIFLLINLIIGCISQVKAQTSSEMLKDKPKREEIIATISSDHKMIRKMMVNNPMMMNTMLGMMEKDSSMCTMMGNLMMQNNHMMNMMGNMVKTRSMMMNGKMMNGGRTSFICPQHKETMRNK